MKTRCKFRVQKVTEFDPGYGNKRVQEITLGAQYSDKPEDHEFSEATPSGSLVFTVTNQAVIDQFKPGQEYYIDLIPAG